MLTPSRRRVKTFSSPWSTPELVCLPISWVSFSRLSRKPTARIARKYGGTGLGLCICERLCLLMGGRIWAESEPGDGSVFRFIVPFTQVSNPTTKTPPPDAEQKILPARVLVVDDDPFSAQVAKMLISGSGGTTTIAETGKEALQILRDRHRDFDLVMLDIQMPDLDGISVAKAARDIERENGWTPVMMAAVTANTMREDEESCMAAGMDAFITKPITKSKIRDILCAALGRCRGTSLTPGSRSSTP